MRFGQAEIERFVEWVGPVGTVSALLPDVPAEAWAARSGSLAPRFWLPETDGYRVAIQTWVVRVDGLTVVVDTGVGDGRERPHVPQFTGLSTGFDAALAAGGVDPEQVDVVVNTHIHYDHVGWNTRRVGDEWVPTFPNARYLVPQRDHDTFKPGSGALRPPRTEDERRRFDGIRLVFDDSIRPIEEAGLLDLWSGRHDISPSLRLIAAPGHTPGSSVLRLDAGDRQVAFFVGDLLHSPLQLELPDAACAFDLDAEEASASRARILAEVADEDALLLPAHLAGHGAARLEAVDGGYAVSSWADLPEL